jgi:hypothetical protein
MRHVFCLASDLETDTAFSELGVMRNLKALLRNIGVALYRLGWEAELARRRGTDVRTVRAWYAGRKPIPESLWLELRDEIGKRKLDLDELQSWLPY